jgi:hypothetical protein
MAQEVESLPSKFKALSSNLVLPKKIKLKYDGLLRQSGNRRENKRQLDKCNSHFWEIDPIAGTNIGDSVDYTRECS